MRMPGQAVHLRGKVRRRLQAGTRGELADRAAIDLLPGRLVLQGGRRVGLAARGDLRVAEQQVDAPVVEVDAHAVAGLDEGEAGAGGGLRRGVEDRGAARGAALAAVAEDRMSTRLNSSH